MSRTAVAVVALSGLMICGASSGSLAAETSPVFGTANVQKLDNDQMRGVVGSGSTSAYYAYLGNYSASAAIQQASYGIYLEYFGNAYRSSRWTAYANAYYYAVGAANYYAAAYNTN